jgi:hypothetical protein
MITQNSKLISQNHNWLIENWLAPSHAGTVGMARQRVLNFPVVVLRYEF